MFNVIIVEDDPMVASINKHYLMANPKLKVVGQFSDGQSALDYLSHNPVDLAILDVYLPIMDGVTLLSRIRSYPLELSVIMVTAANDLPHVRQLMALGITDYLVKPFEQSRFNQAIETFIRQQELMSGGCLNQHQIDNLFNKQTKAPISDELIEKGLQPKTLDRILAYMESHQGTPLTCDQIACKVSLSRVTIRRYMNYLLEQQKITSDINYTTGGRPSIMYRYNPDI